MKILYVITSLTMGGAEKLAVDLIPRLWAKGHVVDIAVFNGKETPLMQKLRQDAPQAKIYKLGTGYYNPLYILKLMRLMRRYDLVHTHNSSPQLFASIAKVVCSVVLCTTEHTTSNRKRGWKWYVPIDRWMYNRYRKVICVSQKAEESLRAYIGKSRADILTINNGVDVEGIHSTPVDEALRDKKGRFALVMVAALRPQKDHDTLIRAMQRLPKADYVLWIVGDGACREQLEARVKELHLEDNVHFWGLRTDIPALLKAADVVIMSSHFEGLSLSSIEGMSAGKPFVASKVNGLKEVAGGYGVLFEHGDDKALADIVCRLHDDEGYYNKVAEACYRRALQFDINKTVDGYDEVYRTINSK